MFAVNSFVILVLVYVANCKGTFLPFASQIGDLINGALQLIDVKVGHIPIDHVRDRHSVHHSIFEGCPVCSLRAPYITPCDFKSDKFTECIKEQIEIALPKFANGIPEMDVPSIDPVHLQNIEIGGSGLNLIFTDAAMHGLSQCKITELKTKFSKTEGIFSLAFKGDFILTAQYVADGSYLFLPIQGNGAAFIKAQGVEVNIVSKLVHYRDGNGEHVKLAAPKYKYIIERTTFDLKNLFNGNKQLAETTLQFANENWKHLMNELSPPVIIQIVRTVLRAINKFFSKVTIKQMFKGYSDE